MPTDRPQSSWTFFTNHGHVLICLAFDHDITVRELSRKVGITERAVLRIIGELEAGGVVVRTREGRRNHYIINPDEPLRHPLEDHCKVGDLIGMVVEGREDISS